MSQYSGESSAMSMMSDDPDDAAIVRLVKQKNWEELKTRSLNYPHDLIVPDERSQIAICYAIQKKAPLEIIQWMCDTHYFNYDPSLFDARVEMQDMLLMGNTAGNLPIHFAALSGSTEVIEYIGDMCLEALVKRNSNDLTALELAEDKDKRQINNAVEDGGQQSHLSSASAASSKSAASADSFDELGNKKVKSSKSSGKKWKKHKRAGYKRAMELQKRRGSSSINSQVSLNKQGIEEVSEHTMERDCDDDADLLDDRVGDAEDRVKDVDHVLDHGVDVDETETEYVTQYTTVKKKKRWRFMNCFGIKKRPKVIGY
ncbi:hypothetical protein TeGR_g7019 [Tetraparma gracilis]|uniref:Ankyrin repeat protein n=1 Tax=Tetraparma gracilis TaxID=2962635 RepID=A0ABQ6NAK0_9STRA|nr:hypothetical protein TeGR_g7019 [Tetraparma gracilis]